MNDRRWRSAAGQVDATPPDRTRAMEPWRFCAKVDSRPQADCSLFVFWPGKKKVARSPQAIEHPATGRGLHQRFRPSRNDERAFVVAFGNAEREGPGFDEQALPQEAVPPTVIESIFNVG